MGEPLIYYRNKAVLGFPGEESLVFKFFHRRGLSSATGARRIPRQEAALKANLTKNGLMKIASGAAPRASASRDVMEVHRMLAHPSEDITRKTAVIMGIETMGQWGACETCFQAKVKRHAVPKKTDERASVRTRKIVKRQAVQWVDGPKKTGGDGTGSDDRGMKSAGDGAIIERRTPQLDVQELGQEQQLTLHEHETQEAFGTGSDNRGMKSAGDGTIIERGTPQLDVQELGQEQQLTLHEHDETQEAFGTDSDDYGMKSAGDGTFVKRGTPQLNVQELGQEQQLTLDEHETQEAFGTGSDDRGMKSARGGTVVGRRGAVQLEVQELELEQQPASSLELRKEVQEAPPDPEQGTHKKPHRIPRRRHGRCHWTPKRRHGKCHGTPKRRHARSHWTLKRGHRRRRRIPPRRHGGPVVPASRKHTIGGNLPPNNLKAHVEPAGARRRGRRSTAKFSADEQGRQRGECVDVRRRGARCSFRGKWSYRTR